MKLIENIKKKLDSLKKGRSTDKASRSNRESPQKEAKKTEFDTNVESFEKIEELELLCYELDSLKNNEKITDLLLLAKHISSSTDDESLTPLKQKIVEKIGELLVSLGRLGERIAAKILKSAEADPARRKCDPPKNISYADIGRIVVKDTGITILVYIGGTLASLLFGVLVSHKEIPRFSWAIFIPSFGALTTILFKIFSSIRVAIEKTKNQNILRNIESYRRLLEPIREFEKLFTESLPACRQLLDHYYDQLKIKEEYRGIVPIFTIGEQYRDKNVCHNYEKEIKKGRLFSDPKMVLKNHGTSNLQEEQIDLANKLKECQNNINQIVSYADKTPEDISRRMDEYRQSIQARLQNYETDLQEVKTPKRKLFGISFPFLK